MVVLGVVGAVVVLAARSDRRARGRGHVLRGSGQMSSGLRNSKAKARVRERTDRASALPEHRDLPTGKDRPF